jgi:zinc protease
MRRTIGIVALTGMLSIIGCQALKDKIISDRDKTFSREERKSMNKTEDVLKMRLDNGIELVVEENHSVPVVGLNVWVKVGSADEVAGEEGLAHVHEHMLFKGTEGRGRGQIAREVEAMGGDINAFTSMDYTVYYIVVASRFFDQALDILSDAIRRSSFDARELEKELMVILEELQRGKDSPRHRIYEYLFDQAYQRHPYQRPVIGYRETISGLSRKDVVAFFNKWYQPQNMVVSVAGDIDREEAAVRIKQKFDAQGAEHMPESPREIREPAQEELRVGLYREDVMEGYMYLGFHIPEFAHQDMAALDVLSVILGTGESSRLMERVRSEKRLVSNIWSFAYTPRNPGMFMVGCNFMPEKLTQALEEILREIYLLRKESIPEWELERARRHVESESIYSRETVQGEARRMGFLVAATGDPLFEDKYLEQVRKLDSKDLRTIAAKYFSSSNLTVSAIIPKGADQSLSTESLKDAIANAESSHGAGSASRGQQGVELPEPARTAGKSGYSAPASFTLKNGIRLLVRENHTVPVVSVRAAFLGGLRTETRDNNGVINFMAEVMTEGTEAHSAEEIHRKIEAMAGSLSGFSGNNSSGITMDVLSAYFDEAFGIFAEVLRSPTFPSKEVEKTRMIILSRIRAQKDQPMRVAMDQYRSLLYPSHPYGMTPVGKEETVKNISRKNLVDAYKNYTRPSNLVIGVAGDVDAKHVKSLVESKLGDWEAEQVVFPEIKMDDPPQEIRREATCMERGQSNIVLGFQGSRFDSDDAEDLGVLTGILSGMGGRLFSRLRDQKSLAYSVYATQIDGIEPGFFYVYIGTSPGKEDEAIQGILAILEEMRNEDVTGQELQRAQSMLIGDFEIGLQRNSAWTARIVFDEMYGLGFDYYKGHADRINAVDKEAVRAAAIKYIHPSAYAISIVRPCGGVKNEGNAD